MLYTKKTLKYMGIKNDPVTAANVALKINEGDIKKHAANLLDINLNLRPAIRERLAAMEKALAGLPKDTDPNNKGPASEVLWELNIRIINDRIALELLDKASMLLSNAHSKLTR